MTILPSPDNSYRARREPMPTVMGDVVVSHAQATDRQYAVWRAKVDGQQSANPLSHSSTVTGGADAMALARLMVRESRGGAIYFVELDTLTWTKLAD